VNVLLAGRRPPLEARASRAVDPALAAGPGALDHRDAYLREVGVESPGEPVGEGPHRRAAAAVLRYDIFQPRVGSPVLRRSPLEVGDTVGLRYRLAPGIALFFASRVVDRFDAASDGTWRTGFTYRTLVGHPERGEETFSVEKDLATGRVVVALRSWSRPGTPLTRLFRPIVRLLQVRASEGALSHLKALARGAREGEAAVGVATGARSTP